MISADAAIGVCYGRMADNLPSPQKAVQLMQSQGISKVRLFSPDADALTALANSNIDVMVGVPNTELQGIAQSQSSATAWVATNLLPHLPATRITAIAAGSEVLTAATDDDAYLLSAMQNLYTALQNAALDRSIKISTPHAMGVIANSFPPSSATFDARFAPLLSPILDFIANTGSFFMLNAYPYYAYRNSAATTALDFALLQPSAAGFTDPGSGLHYGDLLSAQLDAAFYALAAMGHRSLAIVVTETGWPSMGGAGETRIVNLQNAATYNNNVLRVAMSGQGTPFRPGQITDVYIFELFNENQRPGPTANRNWGLFRPDGSKFYSIGGFGGYAGGGTGGGAGGAAGNSPGVIELNRTFCIAAANGNFNTLQANLDWVCGQQQVDCSPVQPGGRCYQPDTVASHASYVFNAYFQLNGMSPNACQFNGVSVITTMDPSYNRCIYIGSLAQLSRSKGQPMRSRWQRFAITVLLFFSIL
ncbi:glucan endo-1,3-beta-glucosidase 13 [Selaginella moellendorffii]|uniref:glucan endo-1,3-beta-glucosidase 13 n=1 Tax=Selaginella moellendorffii TaxID=88036 RepID=UPI000D1C3DA7|nr:glucan endo-1,3-beta-glucosidase 13 [Selaginella moellendorffii]|eukprot:XP_024522150.1 glucan endo-1,3-beta-glucosidase 13 [Selaginella moellendorffii]